MQTEKVFVGWDKAQAEARVVAHKAWLITGDESYKKLIEGKQKIHVWFAHRLVDHGVFKCPKESIKGGLHEGEEGYIEYYIAKVGVHANSYGMGAGKFCRVVAMNTDGAITIQESLAKKIKEVLYAEIPAIPAWQIAVQRWLRANNKVMVTCFGRSRLFFERWSEDLFGEAYAFEPQATVADDVALSILRVWNEMPEVAVLQQNYDSMLGQCDTELAPGALQRMKPLVERPITLWNFEKTKSCTFTIPAVMKVGKNWADMEELP